MGRYPTRNGIAIPVTELGYEIAAHEKGKTNNHHLYFPRGKYVERPLSRIFRGLPLHVVTMLVPEHVELHHEYDPPKSPPTHQMIDIIDEYLFMNGAINVVSESNTSHTYQVMQSKWEAIKNGTDQR